MATYYDGHMNAAGHKFAIITGRFNNFIGDRLVEGALDTLIRHGANDDDIDVVRVPGAFEIPLAAKKLGASGRYDAVICLGTLIRGATPHFDYISSEVTKGIASASMELGVVMSYGVLTCDSIEQAIERAGTKAGNKGAEATLAAIEMVDLFAKLPT